VQDITVRQMVFDFPDRIDPLIVPGDPEEAYVNVGLSLLLPYLEPYLIRTMKAARPHVRDPELREDLERFSAQEGVHYRQHRRFNDAVKRFGFPGLEALEAELDADYRRFSAERPLEWNLAYAEGFEALTTAAAHASFEAGLGMDGDLDPWFRDLISWHLIEELEHRTVAFDVYQHVHGRYLYRLRVGTWAQWHMARWIGRTARHMLEHDERTRGDRRRTPAIRARKRRRLRRTLRHMLPRLLRTYLPGYTPHRIPMTDAMRTLAAEYTARAVRTS
jgi:predicted metal-dependent hydrolase